MKNYLYILIFIFSYNLSAQNPVDVFESTLKIGCFGAEEYLCGFAEGDVLVFNFEEINGKKLKEVEILEYQSFPKFKDYKTVKIIDKKLTVLNTGIYIFRIKNSSICRRICKIKIQRIPAGEQSENFNTTVYWKELYDTNYDNNKEKYLIKADTIVYNITDQLAKVHSSKNPGGNKTSFGFTLPPNTYAWSYYIGVDQEGQKVFSEAIRKISQNAGKVISKVPLYGPLAALVLNGASFLTLLQTGENVKFWFVDSLNLNLLNKEMPFKSFKTGNVINDFSKMTAPLKGQYFLCLQNDNRFRAIDVTVKITAVCINEHWGTRDAKKIKVKSKLVPYLKYN